MVERYCVNRRQQVPSYRQTSAHALILAPHWIMMVRTLGGADEKGKPFSANRVDHESVVSGGTMLLTTPRGAPTHGIPVPAAQENKRDLLQVTIFRA